MQPLKGGCGATAAREGCFRYQHESHLLLASRDIEVLGLNSGANPGGHESPENS